MIDFKDKQHPHEEIFEFWKMGSDPVQHQQRGTAEIWGQTIFYVLRKVPNVKLSKVICPTNDRVWFFKGTLIDHQKSNFIFWRVFHLFNF